MLNSTSSNGSNQVNYLSNVYADSVIEETSKQSSSTERKSEENQVPRLIDSKQKHLQKTLNDARRDQLLLQETKDDAQFRKTLAGTLQK